MKRPFLATTALLVGLVMGLVLVLGRNVEPDASGEPWMHALRAPHKELRASSVNAQSTADSRISVEQGQGSAFLYVGANLPLRKQEIRVTFYPGQTSFSYGTDEFGQLEFEVPPNSESATFQALVLKSCPGATVDVPRNEENVFDFGPVRLGVTLSGVVVEMDNAEQVASQCSVRVGRARDPDSSYQTMAFEAERASRQALFAIRSDTEYGVSLQVRGFHETERFPPLASREWRLHSFDLGSVEHIRWSLAGLPDVATRGQAIKLSTVRDGVVRHKLSDRADTDANGQVSMYGRLPPEGVITSLMMWDGTDVTLRDADGSRFILSADADLYPADPVVPVALQNRVGGIDLESDWSLTISNERSAKIDVTEAAGVKLVRDPDLGERVQLIARVGRESVRVAYRDAMRDADGVIRIALGTQSSAHLAVRVSGAIPKDLTVALCKAGGSEVVAEQAVQKANDGAAAVFDNVAPGRYDCRWYWGLGKGGLMQIPCALSVTLRAGQQEEVRLASPEIRQLEGRFIDWEQMPRNRRPAQVRFGGPHATVDHSGRFEVQAVDQQRFGSALFRGRIWSFVDTVEIIGDRNASEVQVRIRPGSVSWREFSIDRNRDIGIEVWGVGRSETPGEIRPYSRRSTMNLPDERGVVTIPVGADERLIWCAWQRQQGKPRHRAFACGETDSGDQGMVVVRSSGRSVAIQQSSTSGPRRATLTPIWTSPSGWQVHLHTPPMWLDGSPSTVWCPEGVEELALQLSGGSTRVRVSAAGTVVLPASKGSR